jgi:hypothetical protein
MHEKVERHQALSASPQQEKPRAAGFFFAHAPWRKAALERVKGIEPSYAAWEAAVLPLNYTRVRQGF